MPNSVSVILDKDKHKGIFTEVLGTFKSGKVTLHIYPQMKPRLAPCNSPSKVKMRKNCTDQRAWILLHHAVKHSQWALSIVLVVKQNGTI